MTAPQTQVKCLPTYILIDTSYSMTVAQETLNETVEMLCSELILAPNISDFAHVSMISFNTDAHVVLGITDIQALQSFPVLECGGVTNFAAAFELVRSRIDHDVNMLRGQGRKVLRPVVFLLTDGQPTDEHGHVTESWRPAYHALVDPAWGRHPNVVPFGFGDATVEIIRQVATNPAAAFLAVDQGRSDALKAVFATLLRTLVASAQNSALKLPPELNGLVTANKDVM